MERKKAHVTSTTVRTRGAMAVDGMKQKSNAPQKNEESNLKALGVGERLLRNTAVCVALLLCVLALQAVGKENQTISRMVSMDLSESLGSLRFVSNLMPKSVSVFWNMGAEKHKSPADGEIVHTFSNAQPYLQYTSQQARASADGEVMSISIEPYGDQSLRIRHASGLESVYSGLQSIAVSEGEWVERGQVLGNTEILTYELRGEGRSIDPLPYLE